MSSFSKTIHMGRMGNIHRRQRIMSKGLFPFLMQQLAELCYYVGLWQERGVKHFFRRSRRMFAKWWTAIAAAFAVAARFARKVWVSVITDMTNPFKKAAKTYKSLRSVLDEMKDASLDAKRYRLRAFVRNGVAFNRYIFDRFASYALPLICAVICVATVSKVLSLNYVVAVRLNGEDIGYIENESVYDTAKKMINERLVGVDNSTWRPSTLLTITVRDDVECMDEAAMAESLLNASGADIVEATGIYVGGTFCGATTAGELLSNKLDNVLAPYQEEAAALGKNISVRFSRKVEMVEGIYPADAIVAFDDICKLIDSNETGDIYYNAKTGDSVSEIASNNGLTVEKLIELNPGVVLEENTVLQDTDILVAENQPMFSVKMVGTITKVTPIPYETTIVKDSYYDIGYYKVVNAGENGERTTITEIEYQDGIEISRVVVKDEVTKEPVTSQVVVGTGGADASGHILLWPAAVPFNTHISRGFTAGYHLGIDIWGPYGTPLLAAEDGVVIVATQMVWDYGIYCIIDHGNGMKTVYGHASQLLVKQGDVVKRGQVVALMGSTGNSTGNHIHFEVRIDGVKVDPAIYLYN